MGSTGIVLPGNERGQSEAVGFNFFQFLQQDYKINILIGLRKYGLAE